MDVTIYSSSHRCVGSIRQRVDRCFTRGKLSCDLFAARGKGRLIRDSARFSVTFLSVRVPRVSNVGLNGRLLGGGPSVILVCVATCGRCLSRTVSLNITQFFSGPVGDRQFCGNLRGTVAEISGARVGFCLGSGSRNITTIHDHSVVFIRVGDEGIGIVAEGNRCRSRSGVGA